MRWNGPALMDKYEGYCDVYPATRLGIHILSVEFLYLDSGR